MGMQGFPYPPRDALTGSWENPQGTQPFPPPGQSPVPGWFGGEAQLAWNNVAIAATGPLTCRVGVWMSPTFDLAPQFRGMVGDDAINRATQTIWAGTGGTLRVQLHVREGTGTLYGLSINKIDLGHVYSVQKIRPLTAEEDITTRLTAGAIPAASLPAPLAQMIQGTNGLATFSAPGDSSPIRYWQLALIFRQYTTTPNAPPPAPSISIAAGYY